MEEVHAGKMSPKDAETRLRTMGYNLQQAFAEGYIRKYGDYDQTQLQANADFFRNPSNQKMLRQIKSTFEAMEEDKRLAKLVDNPAGTPINSLTGAAKVAFGDSKRAMFNMGNLMTVDETNRIMGGQGGAVEYFKELEKRMSTNMSVKQYIDMMNEARYYVATRWKAYAEGTPLAKTMDKWYQQVKAERPYLDKAETMPENFNEAVDFVKNKIKTNVIPEIVAGLSEQKWTDRQISEAIKQSGVKLKPIVPNIVKIIKTKTKTKEEAESMAIRMGYDPS